ncbi:MAG TPA: NAD(P)H-dependent oxidoreductase [Candidatus Krumholzibacteria bacterium]|nr:NAD(P)H-dependent oxidoreductase [Candidatus Krumholzibacteria bacterium]
MPRPPRIAALAASLRTGSFNRSLIGVAAADARQAGAEVTLVDLREFTLPIYDADTERWDGLPENAHRLKAVFAAQDGFLFSLPEYNGSITPLFKNTIDWASRPVDGQPGLAWARGKPAALVSASNGALGGLRGLYHARWVLQTIGMIVLPGQKALSRAATAFNPDGTLVDQKEHDAVAGVVTALVDVARKLAT